MSGTEGQGSKGMETFHNRPGDADPVKRAGAPANLIEDDQAEVARIVEDCRDFVHFHHEGALPETEVVGCSDTSENPVDHGKFSMFRRDKAAALSHQHIEGNLPHEG